MVATPIHTARRPSLSSRGPADDASENVSVNTLAAFLIDSRSQVYSSDDSRPVYSPKTNALLREQKAEASATINALNQFIFQAGNIYKGKELTKQEEERLREAANHVGLSMKVVDALLEQTADPNAVVKYCMASNDAFARKIKADPHFARLLEEGQLHGDERSFDLADSVWRVFMHKIVQQFLKEHNIELGDIMNKTSLTSQLYEEALRNDHGKSEYDNRFGEYLTNPAEMARIRRDYTQERKQIAIPQGEARKARQAAEAMMTFEPHQPFHDILHRDKETHMIPRGFQSEARDDELSLRPGAYGSDEQSEVRRTDVSQTELEEESRPRGASVKRRQSETSLTSPAGLQANNEKNTPHDREDRDSAKDYDDQTVSAVKRGLAMFEKATPNKRDSATKSGRPSIGKKGGLDMSSARKLFEGQNTDDMLMKQGVHIGVPGHGLPAQVDITTGQHTRRASISSRENVKHPRTKRDFPADKMDNKCFRDTHTIQESAGLFGQTGSQVQDFPQDEHNSTIFTMQQEAFENGAPPRDASAKFEGSVTPKEMRNTERRLSSTSKISRVKASQLAFENGFDTSDDSFTSRNATGRTPQKLNPNSRRLFEKGSITTSDSSTAAFRKKERRSFSGLQEKSSKSPKSVKDVSENSSASLGNLQEPGKASLGGSVISTRKIFERGEASDGDCQPSVRHRIALGFQNNTEMMDSDSSNRREGADARYNNDSQQTSSEDSSVMAGASIYMAGASRLMPPKPDLVAVEAHSDEVDAVFSSLSQSSSSSEDGIRWSSLSESRSATFAHPDQRSNKKLRRKSGLKSPQQDNQVLYAEEKISYSNSLDRRDESERGSTKRSWRRSASHAEERSSTTITPQGWAVFDSNFSSASRHHENTAPETDEGLAPSTFRSQPTNLTSNSKSTTVDKSAHRAITEGNQAQEYSRSVVKTVSNDHSPLANKNTLWSISSSSGILPKVGTNSRPMNNENGIQKGAGVKSYPGVKQCQGVRTYPGVKEYQTVATPTAPTVVTNATSYSEDFADTENRTAGKRLSSGQRSVFREVFVQKTADGILDETGCPSDENSQRETGREQNQSTDFSKQKMEWMKFDNKFVKQTRMNCDAGREQEELLQSDSRLARSTSKESKRPSDHQESGTAQQHNGWASFDNKLARPSSNIVDAGRGIGLPDSDGKATRKPNQAGTAPKGDIIKMPTSVKSSLAFFEKLDEKNGQAPLQLKDSRSQAFGTSSEQQLNVNQRINSWAQHSEPALQEDKGHISFDARNRKPESAHSKNRVQTHTSNWEGKAGNKGKSHDDSEGKENKNHASTARGHPEEWATFPSDVFGPQADFTENRNAFHMMSRSKQYNPPTKSADNPADYFYRKANMVGEPVEASSTGSSTTDRGMRLPRSIDISQTESQSEISPTSADDMFQRSFQPKSTLPNETSSPTSDLGDRYSQSGGNGQYMQIFPDANNSQVLQVRSMHVENTMGHPSTAEKRGRNTREFSSSSKAPVSRSETPPPYATKDHESLFADWMHNQQVGHHNIKRQRTDEEYSHPKPLSTDKSAFNEMNPLHNLESGTTESMSSESDFEGLNVYDVTESQEYNVNSHHVAANLSRPQGKTNTNQGPPLFPSSLGSMSSESDFEGLNVYDTSERQLYNGKSHDVAANLIRPRGKTNAKQGPPLFPSSRDIGSHHPKHLGQQNKGFPLRQGTPGVVRVRPGGYSKSSSQFEAYSGSAAAQSSQEQNGSSFNELQALQAFRHRRDDATQANPDFHTMNTLPISCEQPMGGCVVAGRPLIETSYRPMNGRSPTRTPVPVQPSDIEWIAFGKNGSAWDSSLSDRNPSHSVEAEFEALNSFLDEFEYDGKSQGGQQNVPPQTPVGLHRSGFSEARNPAQNFHDSLALNKSSSTFSGILQVETVHSDEEDLNGWDGPDTAHGVHHGRFDGSDRPPNPVNHPIGSYNSDGDKSGLGDRYAGLEPTSPTHFRSNDDSESADDEREIRAAAQQSGIPSSVVDVILSQTRNVKRMDNGVAAHHMDNTNNGPFDSDTCNPASARHLQKDVGPQPSNSRSYSWDSNEQGEEGALEGPTNSLCASPRGLQRRDPSPVAKNSPTPSMGMPELPEGATQEELKLLNRFIEVAAGNFEGKKLSSDSEARVRSAALKVGLSEKFVDQLLEQAQAKNKRKSIKAPLSTVGGAHGGNYQVPHSPDNITAGGDGETTYYTVDLTRATKRRKKATDVTVAGCNVWEEIQKNIKYWTNINCGGDDGSSISSADTRGPATPRTPGGRNIRALV